MLCRKSIVKMGKVVDNWTNGNKKDAAKIVRGMTKLDVVYLVTHTHQVDSSFIGNNVQRVDFEDFVISALSGMYQ